MKIKINMRNFGETVKKERKASHLTQVEIAKGIGCSRRYIQSIESGKLERLPPMEIIIGLMENLYVSFKELLPEIYCYKGLTDLIDSMPMDILDSTSTDNETFDIPGDKVPVPGLFSTSNQE